MSQTPWSQVISLEMSSGKPVGLFILQTEVGGENFSEVLSSFILRERSDLNVTLSGWVMCAIKSHARCWKCDTDKPKLITILCYSKYK